MPLLGLIHHYPDIFGPIYVPPLEKQVRQMRAVIIVILQEALDVYEKCQISAFFDLDKSHKYYMNKFLTGIIQCTRGKAAKQPKKKVFPTYLILMRS